MVRHALFAVRAFLRFFFLSSHLNGSVMRLITRGLAERKEIVTVAVTLLSLGATRSDASRLPLSRRFREIPSFRK
jgi:hypothetical protein